MIDDVSRTEFDPAIDAASVYIDPVDWSDDDRAIDAELAAEHRRSVCCPDNPTCPWPDACAECDQDWPCETAQSRQPKTAA